MDKKSDEMYVEKMKKRKISEHKKTFSIITLLLCMLVIWSQCVLAEGPITMSNMDLSNAFTITGKPDNIASYTTLTADTITIGDGNGSLDGWYQGAAATSKFSINWSRSFELHGKIAVPKSADQTMFGFHNDKGRPVGGTGPSACYSDGFARGDGTVKTESLANSLAWYVNSFINPADNLGCGSKATTKDVGWVYFDDQGYPHWWNVSGGTGLNAGSWDQCTMNVEDTFFDTQLHDFKIEWSIINGTTGDLTVRCGTSEKKVSGLNIAQIFTDYQQTYFTIATSIYQAPAYNNRQGRAALNINRFAYTAVDPEGEAECYIMRDNGGTRVMYDENNPETWPRYGETINVRYKIKNKLDRSDEAFPMRIETQLAGGESSLIPNSLNVYTESGEVKTPQNIVEKDIFNGVENADGIKKTTMITLPAKSEPLYVEYQVKLGNVPVDSKIGGKMILGDEGMTQTNVESQVEVSDPVCKIGTKYYYKLSSAVAAATDGSRIEMLVGNLSLEEIKIQNKNLTITTASNTGELPYHGAEGSFGILSRTGGKGYLNLENSTVILENIILSENKDSGIAGSQAILKADQRSNLTLGSGVSLSGVVLSGTIADEAPVVLCGSSKLTMTDNAVISDCQSPKGGAVYMDDTSQFIMTGGNILKNKATIEGGGIYAEGGTGSTLELFGGNIKENTAPIAGGVAIKNSMLIQIKGCPFVTQNINAQGKDSNLSLPKGQSIRLMGMLDDTSVIGVTTTAEDHIIGHIIADASMAGETVLNQTIAKNTIQRIQDDWEKNLQIGQPKMDGSKVCFVKAPVFKLKNVIAEDSQKPLSGVVFKMYRLVDDRTDLDSTKIARLRDDRNQLAVEKDIQDGYWQEQKYSINGQSVEELTTPADGILNLGELGNGDYMLVEKQTATGYQLPVGQWMISVDGSESDATDRIKITTRGSGLDRPLSITVKTTEESIEYSLRHVKSIVLPFAGFNGNRPNYQIVGLCLLTGISVVLAITKTKGGGVKK